MTEGNAMSRDTDDIGPRCPQCDGLTAVDADEVPKCLDPVCPVVEVNAAPSPT